MGLAIAAAGICGMEVRAVTAGLNANPYEWIVERNPFALRPPAPVGNVPVIPPVPPQPLAAVEVTGVTSILSTPRVLLEIVPGPGKPMLRPILGVGERVDTVEVISINVDRSEVMLRNGSSVTNVSLKVARAGTPHSPAGGDAIAGVVVSGELQSAPQAVANRRSIALGGGAPAPERVMRVPRLPPVPPSMRSVPTPGPETR